MNRYQIDESNFYKYLQLRNYFNNFKKKERIHNQHT